MKAIVNTAPGKLEWQELPLPQPGAGQVRIRTHTCAICATDLEMIAGWERTGFPSIPGHEWCGTVDAVGVGVDAALAGRPCVAENVWNDGGEVGFEHPGGYGQYLITQADRVQPLPAKFPLSTAALVEPLAVVVRGHSRLVSPIGSPVMIFGDGPIGLLSVAVFRDAGATDLTLVGGRDSRLALAQKLGASKTLNYHQLGNDLTAAIRRETGRLFPTIVEASGSATAAAAAMDLAAPDGQVLVLGDYGQTRANFPWVHLLHREIRLVGSNASAGAWTEAVRLATSGSIDLGGLITHSFPAKQFAEAFELLRSHPKEVVKAVLVWEP